MISFVKSFHQKTLQKRASKVYIGQKGNHHQPKNKVNKVGESATDIQLTPGGIK